MLSSHAFNTYQRSTIYFVPLLRYVYLFFYFQAEDGIRDGRETGVQTCALPISCGANEEQASDGEGSDNEGLGRVNPGSEYVDIMRSCTLPMHAAVQQLVFDEVKEDHTRGLRSEERRVGKEGGSRGGGPRGRHEG